MIAPRFSADEMLGSLARWLRLMGYDTWYERDRTDTDILQRARKDGRFLLTRDKKLTERAGIDGLYIVSDNLEAQVRQVSMAFVLKFDEERSRCTVCNGELNPISREEASLGVPDGALRSSDHFFRCSKCGKYYWWGSHWKDIRKKMATMTDLDQDSSR